MKGDLVILIWMKHHKAAKWLVIITRPATIQTESIEYLP